MLTAKNIAGARHAPQKGLATIFPKLVKAAMNKMPYSSVTPIVSLGPMLRRPPRGAPLVARTQRATLRRQVRVHRD